MTKCIACSIANKTLEANIVYEDDLVCCFIDIDPINKGHVLIVPKKHKLDLDSLTDDEVFRLMKVAQKILIALKDVYKMDGYTIMQNGGDFNELNHFHLHIFPRHYGDGFAWTSLDNKLSNDIALETDKIKRSLADKG